MKKNESTVIQPSLGSISVMSPRKIPDSESWNLGTGWSNLSPWPGWIRPWALGSRDQFNNSTPQTSWSSASEASSSSSEPSTMSSWQRSLSISPTLRFGLATANFLDDRAIPTFALGWNDGRWLRCAVVSHDGRLIGWLDGGLDDCELDCIVSGYVTANKHLAAESVEAMAAYVAPKSFSMMVAHWLIDQIADYMAGCLRCSSVPAALFGFQQQRRPVGCPTGPIPTSAPSAAPSCSEHFHCHVLVVDLLIGLVVVVVELL